MSTKKLINSADSAVSDALAGLVAVNPDVALLQGFENVVLRSDLGAGAVKDKVALVCGGGSGHEPAHAGFVARGMLTAAVCGAVFASPPVSSILACLRTVWRSGGPSAVLLIVKNYTGDRVNFGLALERARAEGVSADMVVVGDDCALTSEDKSAGRRGLGGTVLVHKIAGAMAEAGKSLEEIVNFLRSQILPRMGTIGLSLGPCCPPGSQPSFQLASDEAELGLGIHGEAGVRKMKLTDAKSAVGEMLGHMTKADSATRLDLPAGSDVVLLVNNLGGTSNLEMGVVVGEVLSHVKGEMGLRVQRVIVGNLMTALEMPGVSVTVLRCQGTAIADCLDASVDCPAWPRSSQHLERSDKTPTRIQAVAAEGAAAGPAKSSDPAFDQFGQGVSDEAVGFACEALKSCEAMLNKFDSGSGDGDCGSTLRRGADRLLERLCAGELTSLTRVFDAVSAIAEHDMGGSAGAMYSILFATASAEVGKRKDGDDIPTVVFQGLDKGCKAMMKYGGAEKGDRTMLDALLPLVESVTARATRGKLSGLKWLEEATVAAENGAKETTNMKAQAGRASYVASSQLVNPDPGAHAVGIIMRAIFEAAKKRCQAAGRPTDL